MYLQRTAFVAVSLVVCVCMNVCLQQYKQLFFFTKNICKDNSLNLNEKHFCYSKTHTEYKVGHFSMQFAIFILKKHRIKIHLKIKCFFASVSRKRRPPRWDVSRHLFTKRDPRHRYFKQMKIFKNFFSKK